MNRRILIVALAVLLAVLGATAVLIYVNKADTRALEGQQPVTVLVAVEPIAAGTSADDAKESLRTEMMPASSVPSDVLSEISDAQDKLVTSTDLAQGQLLTRRMLVDKATRGEVVLPKGKLAVSIPVEGAEQAGGQLKPGFMVAVFDTFNAKNSSSGNTQNGERLQFGDGKLHATRLVLAKVEVISVVAEKKRSKTDDGKFGKFMVTVAVTQSEAEKLIHALNTGTVSLAQVNDDSEVKPGPGVDNDDLFKQSRKEDRS